MTIYLKKDNHDSEHLAKIIQSKIEFTNLMDVTVRTEIFYDPNIHKTKNLFLRMWHVENIVFT
jgi:hypothetical protein